MSSHFAQLQVNERILKMLKFIKTKVNIFNKFLKNKLITYKT